MSKASWGSRPSGNPDRAAPRKIDDFVKGGGRSETKRLNAYIPADLHARVKAGCALEGRDMTAVLIELLEQRFPRQRPS